jgi:hypothetical protein
MNSRKAFIPKIQDSPSNLSTFARAALACVEMLTAMAALAARSAFAGAGETITTAALTGAPIGGVTPTGEATFRLRDNNERKLEDSHGDFHKAELVRAFIESIEYRNRFDW